MASALEVLNGVGSVAGIVGIGYQIYTTQRDRAERRRAQIPADRSGPAMAPGSPAPGSPAPGYGGPPTTAAPNSAEGGTWSWLDLVAPLIMNAYFWLMALGGFSYIGDPNAAGSNPDGVQAQLRWTVVLLVVNTVWAAVLAYKHLRARPGSVRVWAYGLASLVSLGAAIGLAAAQSSIVF